MVLQRTIGTGVGPGVGTGVGPLVLVEGPEEVVGRCFEVSDSVAWDMVLFGI